MQTQSVHFSTHANETRRRNESLLENGVRLIETLPEHFPDNVDPRTRRVFDDIRGTLHVPVVNFMFRVLANYPEWLERSWAEVSELVLDDPVEQAVRELSHRAAALTAGEREIDGHPLLIGIEAQARAYTDTIAYVLPKLLLIATAFAHSFERRPRSGGAARLWPHVGSLEPSVDEHAEHARGIAAWTVALPLINPREATGRVAAALQDIREQHGHCGLIPFYRGLANWPALLIRFWAAIRPVVGSERYFAWRDALVSEAEEAWQLLDISIRVRRPPVKGEEIEAVVNVFRRRIIPELMLDVMMIERLLAAGVPHDAEAAH